MNHTYIRQPVHIKLRMEIGNMSKDNNPTIEHITDHQWSSTQREYPS